MKRLASLLVLLATLPAPAQFAAKLGPEQITLDEANILIAESRDPAETKALYEGWRTISPVMAADYARMVEIANEGSRELGFADTGAMWRAGYDMEPDAFAAETDRLWEQVKPFYENLHCYVRGRLNARYGDAVQPDSGRKQSIPASETVEEKSEQSENLEVLLTRNTVAINGDFVSMKQFVPRLRAKLDGKSKPEDRIVVVKSKPETPYHHWIQVTTLIEDAGGIITLQMVEEREVQIPQ